jgi:hypothetical protein
MNKVTKSINSLSRVFDLLLGSNFETAIENVMKEYPYIRYRS